METDYSKIKLNPIFEPIKKIFEFFILAVGFVAQQDFQKVFSQTHPELVPFIITYNQEVNLRREGNSIKSDNGLYFVNIGRLMAISIFDILQASQYNKLLNNTEIFKFAKHVRNGAAHSNKFNITSPIKTPISWRDKTITNSLNDSIVFPDFINPIILISLMSDISELIEKKLSSKSGLIH